MSARSDFFVVGGALRPDAPCYVERRSDEELFGLLRNGEYCSVLTSRQMGKSSLMVRTARRLRQEGRRVAQIDLTALGHNVTPEQWYRSMLDLLEEQLGLEEELSRAWRQSEGFGPVRRFLRSLPISSGPVVVFIDEIESVRSLPFSTDEFFAGIRERYNRRADQPELRGLTFCLLGVVSPSDLIRDPRTTPYNIGRSVELTDFREEEARTLLPGLVAAGATAVQAATYLARVLSWTGGHPYLTQRLCEAVSERLTKGGLPPSGVEGVCAEAFLSTRAQGSDPNLTFVRDQVVGGPDGGAEALALWQRVRREKRWPVRPGRVRAKEADPAQDALRLAGLVRVHNGFLRPSNRIYRQVFDRAWLERHLPDAELRRQRAAYRRGVVRATAISGTVALVTLGLASAALWNWSQERHMAGDLRSALARERILRSNLERTAREREAALIQSRHAAEAANGSAALARKEQEVARAAQSQAQSQAGRAGRALVVAEQQRRLAERRGVESQERLARLQQANGYRLVREGDRFAGLPWFASALAQSPTDPGVAAECRREIFAILKSSPRLCGIRNWRPVPPDGATRSDAPGLAIERAGSTVRLRNRESGKIVAGPYSINGGCRFARVSPDGHWLLVIEAGLLWHLGSGEPPRQLPRGNTVSDATFRPDGKQLALAGQDGGVQLFDCVTAQPVGPALRHPGTVDVLRFSPDGTKLAAVMHGSHSAWVWDLRTHSRTGGALSHRDNIDNVAFSPDNSRIATASRDGTARVWAATGGEPLTPPFHHAGPVYEVHFSRDGRKLITGSADGLLREWDLEAAWPTATAPLQCPPGEFGISSSGRWGMRPGSEGTYRFWDRRTQRPVSPVVVQSTSPVWAYFSPDERFAALMSKDGSGRVVRVPDGQPAGPVFRHRGRVSHSAIFSPDDRRLATCSPDDGEFIWEIGTGRLACRPVEPLVGTHGLEFSQDGTRIFSYAPFQDHSEVRVWDARTGAALGPPIRNGTRWRHPAFSPDGTLVATPGEEGYARLWNVATGRETVVPMFHPKQVSCLSFNKSGKYLATGCYDGMARLWETRTGRSIGLPLPNDRTLEQVAFDPTSRFLLTGTMFEWDTVWEPFARDRITSVPPTNDLNALLGVRGGISALQFVAPETRELPAAFRALSPKSAAAIARLLSAVTLPDGDTPVLGSRNDFGRDRSAAKPLLTLLAPTLAEKLQWDAAEAERCRLNAEWAGVNVHLSALPYTSSQRKLLRYRADARARLGWWGPAAADLAAVFHLDPKEVAAGYQLGLLRLRTGNLSGYRALCDHMLRRTRSSDAHHRDLATWTCAIGPCTRTQAMTALRLLDRLPPAQRNGPTQEQSRGALLYRVGRYAEAVEHLQRAGVREDRDVETALFLAMSLRWLGRNAEADARLRQATEMLARLRAQSAREADAGSWDERVEAELLEREAAVPLP